MQKVPTAAGKPLQEVHSNCTQTIAFSVDRLSDTAYAEAQNAADESLSEALQGNFGVYLQHAATFRHVLPIVCRGICIGARMSAAFIWSRQKCYGTKISIFY